MKSFNLISHFLKDFSFNSPNTPELFFHQNDTSAQIKTNIDVQVKGTDDNLYMVDILLKLHSVLNKDAQTVFSISIDYAGIVRIDQTDNEEITKETLMVDVPQFLFPYISLLVLQISNVSGFPPYVMPPLDFQQMYEQKKEQKPIDFFNL